MANPFIQYLQDTRAELRHVAWPTQTQTIIYSVLVAALSIAVAVYLGLFDFLFTSGLKRFLGVLPQNIPAQTQQLENNQTATNGIKSTTSTNVIIPAVEIPISQ